jgi:hypothetical protein
MWQEPKSRKMVRQIKQPEQLLGGAAWVMFAKHDGPLKETAE